jgi:regulator of protease activity HflC (stomatin/prohibitin superfamily)
VELKTRTVPNQIAEHAADFIAAIKEGRRPKADIEEAYRSAALVHLGNTAVQLGRSLKFDPATNRAVGDAEADRLLDGSYRDGHWAVPQSPA